MGEGETVSDGFEKINIEALNKPIQPFLKWAGGKRWFVYRYAKFIPKTFNRYLEPFLGSGAVFFNLKPQKAILGDVNEELIETYKAIKQNWKAVYKKLTGHHHQHSKDYYYKVRKNIPKTSSSKAARLIYLNRTCWNGLYRVNLKGIFNVPIGTKTNVVLETDDFPEIANRFKNVKFISGDFEKIISIANKNDLLFADPPYTVKHNKNGFIKYNEVLFNWEDQIRLKEALIKAKKRGAKILLTNAYHPSIIKLYSKDFKITKLQRTSKIAADSKSRQLCDELLVWN